MEQEGGERTAFQVQGTACERTAFQVQGTAHAKAGRLAHVAHRKGKALFSARKEGLEKRGLWDLVQVSSRPLQSALFLLPFQNDNNSLLLHNYVLGAQLDHESVNDLREPINISFWHNQSLVLWGASISTPCLPPSDCPVEHRFDQTKTCETILEMNCFKSITL